jgi:hypothetical protein
MNERDRLELESPIDPGMASAAFSPMKPLGDPFAKSDEKCQVLQTDWRTGLDGWGRAGGRHFTCET